MEKIIQVKNLTKNYGGRLNQTQVLNNLSFSVDQGEFVGIMGPSGAGKTTLLNVLSAMDQPTFGHVEVAGKLISKMKEAALSEFRRKMLGFIFQDFNLLASLTVQDNILLPLAIDHLPAKEAQERMLQVTKSLGVAPLLARYPEELSVGQRQRVATARALVVQPAIVFADEPTGALDSRSASELLSYLKELNQKEKTTILMVTHDPYTASYCNRILVIKDGVIFAEVVRSSSQQAFFEKIIDMQATLAGGSQPHAF
ncbi:MAG: ABC transporter ATP-binding protein [Enterococcus sp.]